MSTAGGTEMYHGMHLGIDLLDEKKAAHCRKQLVIFTDGNTYGDEKECLLLARQAASKKVVITGFGFGSEWNDIFLDKLTSVTGGETKFIASSQDLDQDVYEKFNEFNQLFSQSAKLALTSRKGVRINSAFRLRPNPAPLEIEDVSMLGNVRFNDKLSVLLEFGLQPNLNLYSDFRLGQGFITVESAYWESEIRKFVTFEIAFAAELTKNPVPVEIDNALAIITMYRIQEKARQDVINGKPEQAIFKLTHLINHLTELGHHSLVKQVLIERDSIVRSGNFSRGGDKTIKYGTRALLLPEN
ncbi:MAG TPA: VWA domain-containing protein [Anaerolineaceae bacterium]|nr:VWA domain-containing protein [Anaerolineaceae bacterium]